MVIRFLLQILKSAIKHKSNQRQYVNKWVQLHSNKALFVNSYNFPITKYYLFKRCFPTMKIFKTLLAHRLYKISWAEFGPQAVVCHPLVTWPRMVSPLCLAAVAGCCLGHLDSSQQAFYPLGHWSSFHSWHCQGRIPSGGRQKLWELFFKNYILLIMLLQLSQFFPFWTLSLVAPLPSSNLPSLFMSMGCVCKFFGFTIS